MKILLMANFSNPRFHDVWKFLSARGHLVNVTDNHEGLDGYDLGVSWYYRKIVKQEDLDQFRLGVINFHPGVLPSVKGAFTNIWPIIHSGLPCGVSAQVMDAGLDTGPIICEKRIRVEPTDTGETLWHRLVDTQVELLVENWDAIENHALSLTLPTLKLLGPQPWKMSDVQKYDNISSVENGDYVVDILRARTFPPHTGAYVVRDGRKIGVRVELTDLGPA